MEGISSSTITKKSPYKYYVVPFTAFAKEGESLAQAAAVQFMTLINDFCSKGWEYYRMDHYSVLESPGCISSLLGEKSHLITYDVAVFRAPAK